MAKQLFARPHNFTCLLKKHYTVTGILRGEFNLDFMLMGHSTWSNTDDLVEDFLESEYIRRIDWPADSRKEMAWIKLLSISSLCETNNNFVTNRFIKMIQNL